MREISIIETNDGKRFETEEEAVRYLDDKFGEIITGLSIKLSGIDTYVRTIKFIEDNLEKFGELLDLKYEISKGVYPFNCDVDN